MTPIMIQSMAWVALKQTEKAMAKAGFISTAHIDFGVPFVRDAIEMACREAAHEARMKELNRCIARVRGCAPASDEVQIFIAAMTENGDTL